MVFAIGLAIGLSKFVVALAEDGSKKLVPTLAVRVVALAAGVVALAAGVVALAVGVAALAAGVAAFFTGASLEDEESESDSLLSEQLLSVFLAEDVDLAEAALEAGVSPLAAGVVALEAGVSPLAAGVVALAAGVSTLAAGVVALAAGL